MPLLSKELLELLIVNIETNFDIIVPVNQKGMFEPLVAIYQKSCIPVLSAEIEKGSYKLQKIFNKLDAKKVVIDNEPAYQLYNVNTPDEFHKLQQ